MKWPHIQTWTLPQLVRLKASWEQICPEDDEQEASLRESLAEVNEAIARQIVRQALRAHQPLAPDPAPGQLPLL